MCNYSIGCILYSSLQTLSNFKNILLLQGSIGSFFRNLSEWLRAQGCLVFKLNFNGGDEYFYPNTIINTHNYYLKAEEFRDYLSDFILKNKINAIVCFGDTRFYHHIARSYCQQNPTVTFWVFEEGYFRPEYITLEQDGVNDYSKLPRTGAFF